MSQATPPDRAAPTPAPGVAPGVPGAPGALEAPGPTSASAAEIVIRGGVTPGFDVAELWAYRELFWSLAARSVLAQYKQTLMGVLWAFARPIMMVLVMTWLFKRVAGMNSGAVPYPLMVFAGVLPWQLFANSLTTSAVSTLANSRMISKVYFPRVIVPAAACITALVDFLVGGIVFTAMMIWYGQTPDWHIALLPLMILLALTASLGGGLWLSALNVRYRDVGQAVPFIVQIGLLLSPVGFSTAAVPGNWQLVYALNPMVSVINGFRWALLGSGGELQPMMFAISTAVALTLLATGLWFFTRMQWRFADVI